MGALVYVKHDGLVAKMADEAFDMLINNKHHTVVMYSSNVRHLQAEVSKVYNKIRELNKKIDTIDNQWIATEPYYWDDIDGCLGVKCVEIDINTVSKVDGTLAIFTGWKCNVLNRKP